MKSVCMMLLFFQVITYIPEESAQYVGGTVTAIPQQAVGELITADENILSFTWQKAGQSGGNEWKIPYQRVTYLGYGQHAGRRVGTAAALAPAAVMMTPVFFPVIWSKKRRHYLTLAFKDGVPNYLVRAKGDVLEIVLAPTGSLGDAQKITRATTGPAPRHHRHKHTDK